MTKHTLPALIAALAAATADVANAQMGHVTPVTPNSNRIFYDHASVGDAYLNTQVTVTDTDGVEGFTTYRLTVNPESTNVKNIYTICESFAHSI